MTHDPRRLYEGTHLDEETLVDFVNHAAPPERRVAVARALSERPEVAARTFAEIADREELVLALGLRQELSLLPTLAEPVRPVPVRRLPYAGVVVAGLALGLVLGAGGVGLFGARPDLVASALAADETTRLRLDMASVDEDASVDGAEIAALTGIDIPAPIAGWQVIDAQVYPSDFGAAVVMAVDVPGEGMLTLFAVQTGGPTARPT